MHMIKLIHFDIKPANILYSNHYQSPVFIDFGLSEIVNSSEGEKEYMSFRGTYEFCSKEMASAHQ